MVLSNLFPVFSLIVIGYLLKRFRLTNETFLGISDRLVYFIFFPALIFWKIGGAPLDDSIRWSLCISALVSVAIVYLACLLAIWILRVPSFQAGSFAQSCFRFNTYIGMAIILGALGDEGVNQFSVLIGFVTPFINILAVSTLIWFSRGRYSSRERTRYVVTSIITNPLIVACFTGMLYSWVVGSFPTFLDNALRLSSAVALPLALVSIGGAFTLTSLRGHMALSLVASTIKLLLLPLIGYAFLKTFNVTGITFDVGIVFFLLPTSPALYILSSQLRSDTDLASASIVLSTILSILSLSVALVLI